MDEWLIHCISNTKGEVCRAEIFKVIVNQKLCCPFSTLLIILPQKDSAPFTRALMAFHSPVCSAFLVPRAGEKGVYPSACSPVC